MPRFDGVLFDFGHTLFDTVSSESLLAQFRERSGHDVVEEKFISSWAAIRARSREPEEMALGRDVSPELYRRCWAALLAPLDTLADGLAEFTYEFESSAKGWRPYPDVREVLELLRLRGIPTGVVSDCGWDIRTAFSKYGLDELVGGFDLSYEHGVAKPAWPLFDSACSKLGVVPERTLMVGDNWLTDGGAAAFDITTLILPARNRTANPALSLVMDLVS